MKKRKQTCSTKHIPCAKVKIFFSLQKLYFTASIAAIVCCLGKNPRKKFFFQEYFGNIFSFGKVQKVVFWPKGVEIGFVSTLATFMAFWTHREVHMDLLQLYLGLLQLFLDLLASANCCHFLSISKKKCLPKSTFYAALATCIISCFRNSLFPEESFV